MGDPKDTESSKLGNTHRRRSADSNQLWGRAPGGGGSCEVQHGECLQSHGQLNQGQKFGLTRQHYVGCQEQKLWEVTKGMGMHGAFPILPLGEGRTNFM